MKEGAESLRSRILAKSQLIIDAPGPDGPPEVAWLQGARVLANGMLAMPLVQLMIYLLPLQCSALPFCDTVRRLSNHLLEVRLAVSNRVEEKTMVVCKITIVLPTGWASFCRKECLSLVVS